MHKCIEAADIKRLPRLRAIGLISRAKFREHWKVTVGKTVSIFPGGFPMKSFVRSREKRIRESLDYACALDKNIILHVFNQRMTAMIFFDSRYVLATVLHFSIFSTHFYASIFHAFG
jgi:hypothetical protein